jgi:TrmH family RNA methyltransferase
MSVHSKIKLIRSLEQKKYRRQHGLFVVEGDKSVSEILTSRLTVRCILAKEEWLRRFSGDLLAKAEETLVVNEKELLQISFLKTPHQAVALVQIPEYALDYKDLMSGLSLYLDQVQDPGNLGTIIRIADWFGIRHVLCGEGCADSYHPKTVQSTMGAIIRVKTYPVDISVFGQLNVLSSGLPVYGTFPNGNNIYEACLPEKAMIVMGNESKGISSELAQYVTQPIGIPSYPAGTPTSESLNVATATAIVCSEFRRSAK